MTRNKTQLEPRFIQEHSNHARIVSIPNEVHTLDTLQLNQMEQSFRSWVTESRRSDVQLSRKRILLIFLLIRYTGAKLHEVLNLNPFHDIDFRHQTVLLGRETTSIIKQPRKVQIPVTISEEIKAILSDSSFKQYLSNLFQLDPAHVRRKFYERATDCGFLPAMGTPESIRKSRAIELMRNNVPLPVVQKMLGHSTINVTASYVDFSDDEIQKAAKYFIEKESSRKTSARNRFFGKISDIKKGDIQAKVEMISLSGDTITTIITNDSLARLSLKKGSLLTAEVKAPWVHLQCGDREPKSSAENRFLGTVMRIHKGKITSEVVVSISDGTELCSIVSSESPIIKGLQVNDHIWALFNSFAIVLHID